MEAVLRAIGRPRDFLISLMDASALVLVLFPALFRWVYSPMVSEASNRKRDADDLKMIFQSSPNAILAIVDETGSIVRVNLQVEKIFGYSPDELLGQKVEILVPERLRTQHVELRKKFMEAPRARQLGVGRNLVGRRKDGSEVPVEIALTPMTAPSGTMTILTTITDISVRKAIEAERDQALKDQEELVAVVSHEIKNPLTTIIFSLDIINKTLPPHKGQKQTQEILDNIRGAAHRMTRITSDLLDVTKINAGCFPIKPTVVDIVNFVEEQISLFQPLAAAKSIHIETEVSVKAKSANCDRDRIAQVLTNLLNNAIKFTGEGGMIRVAVDHFQDRIRFQVTDTGCGIPADQLSHVFDRFWQAKHKQYLGSGLGLYIAKNIVSAHGGELRVISKEGEGSTFYFTLPAKSDAASVLPKKVA